MEIFFTILILILVVSLSGVVTRMLPFQVPLPLMQIVCGALLAWPNFGLHVNFDPELFLVLFIPPLLFADGWKTPTREFIHHGREILGLALALVLVTIVGIGYLIDLLDGTGYSAGGGLCVGGGVIADRCRSAIRYRG
ncbi:Na(+)/H(+) exchanger protein [Yersinia pseudotuberculosis]|nr:Sodium, potassium, lithium and rubidium/H(+) antiporter [Yersinia pseudotuberculosis]SUQ37969.1 Na(+)/H(+) exchanger protein [Yersinia pseudotuberculosis]